MLMPSLFKDNLLDDFFDFPALSRFYNSPNSAGSLMHTDIRETEGSYELAMNLPGFKKEDVKAELKNGYLTVNASANTSHDEKDEEEKYIRRERYCGSCSRSFYIGDQISQEEIKARFEDGVLRITVPKREARSVENTNYIAIEG